MFFLSVVKAFCYKMDNSVPAMKLGQDRSGYVQRMLKLKLPGRRPRESFIMQFVKFYH